MLKKTSCIPWKYFCFVSFIFLVTVAFVMTAGVTFAQTKKAVEQKVSAALVNLNSASQKELEEIKGVGPATAKKIIDGRPYKSVNDLSKAGLNAKAIESVKPFVTFGKAPPAAAVKDVTKPVKEAQKEVKSAAATAAKDVAKPVKEAQKEAKSAATATAKDAAKPVKEAQKEVKSAAKSAAAAVQGAKVNINTADKAALDALPGIGPVKAQAIIDGRPYKTIEDVMKVSGIKEKAFEKIKDMITVR